MVKPFAVVKFPEEKDSLAAVPVGWLSEDELFCTWPMHVKGCQLISLVEAQAPPGVVGKGWEVFPVIVIKTYWTYKKAAKKVRQYVWTSTVETSDFSVPNHVCLVWTLSLCYSAALSSRSVGGQHKTSQAGRRQPQLQPQHSQEENEGVTCYEDDLAETLQAQEVNQPQDNQEASEDPSRVQLKMIHLLVEIRQQNRDILHQFSQLRQDVLDISERVALLEAPAAQAARAPQVLPLILPRLPAESLQELEAAEAAVKEKGVAKALQDQLQKIGGRNLSEVTAGIMKSIMGHPVQVLFSLYGRKGKRAFINLGLCTIAIDAICQKWSVDRVQAQAIIGRWLPGSVDRGGGRRRRFEAALVSDLPLVQPLPLVQTPPQFIPEPAH
ncbi:uncharacterized protein LOC120844164 [Ixodes scapularis]|uniref:uncharacterized protein LOC120844164 n=1 Tax=Ixodes scapularis TaxID=6945 RepID=UPI001C381D52|nr:uncharacterized protein LOC120844164 [Ixodes scapularis]